MRRKTVNRSIVALLAAIMLYPVTSPARTSGVISIRQPEISSTAGGPAYCAAGHNIGKIFLTVNNNGTLGKEYSASGVRDCFTNERLLNCEFPKGSGIEYLFGAAFWIGAVVGRDTLVSTGQDGWQVGTGAEFHPAAHDDFPPGDMIFRSIIDPAKPEFEGAVSEQDYIGVYYDTCRNCQGVGPDVVDGRPHVPLNLKVTQRSYAWSYSYAEDFVLFDYSIENIGQQ
ncbi:MAG: hypothetical protein D6800_11420, partial [Candidatus Zixiibacteriota bacterium]